MNDEGLEFHAVLAQADGTPFSPIRETGTRAEILALIEQRQGDGAILLEVGMTGRGPALRSMLIAMRFGARKMAEADPHTE